jgi:hypothetical protein
MKLGPHVFTERAADVIENIVVGNPTWSDNIMSTSMGAFLEETHGFRKENEALM